MENISRITNKFIFGLPSAIGVPTSVLLTEWWVAMVVVLFNVCIVAGFKITHHAWLAFGPSVTARVTYNTWSKIDPTIAKQMALYDHVRMRQRSHPEINSNSPPELPLKE